MASSSIVMILLATLFVSIAADIMISPRLATDFYVISCPDLPGIIRRTIAAKFAQAPVAAAGTLRIFFHDCMVEGCDASVLVASTASNKAEKDADVNLSLPGDGFDAVTRAKAAVEAKCPGIVSCADVLALSTRELVVLMGGPSWDVRLGRRDDTVSRATRVAGNLPWPSLLHSSLPKASPSKIWWHLLAPLLHQELQVQLASQGMSLNGSSSSSRSGNKGKKKKASKRSDLAYDVLGWVVLAIGIVAWIGMANLAKTVPPATGSK